MRRKGYSTVENRLKKLTASPLVSFFVFCVLISAFFGGQKLGCSRSAASDGLSNLTGQVRWRYQTGDCVSDLSVADGVVYASSDDNHVYALNADTGELRWKYRTGRSGPVIVAGGIVYVRGGHDFYALSSETGELRWKYDAGSEKRIEGFASPAVGDGVVCIIVRKPPRHLGAGKASLCVLNADTGELCWTREINPQYRPPVLVTDGKVSVIDKKNLEVVSLATGDLCWRYESEEESESFSRQAMMEGAIYIASRDGFVRALDAASGEIRWKSRPPEFGRGRDTYPKVAKGMVYLKTKCELYALSADTGEVLWERSGGGGRKCDSGLVGSLMVAGDTIYNYNVIDESIHVLNAEAGEIKWKYKISRGFNGLAVTEGAIFRDKNGRVYALSADTGELRWEYKISGGKGSCGPIVAEGVVYVGDENGNVYAIPQVGNGPEIARGNVSITGDKVKLLWKRKSNLVSPLSLTPGPPRLSVVDGVVYGRGFNGNVCALSGESGDLYWEYEIGSGLKGYTCYFGPTVVGNLVVCAGKEGLSDHIHVLNAKTGELCWTYETGKPKGIGSAVGPVVDSGVVYALNWHDLYAFSADTGTLLRKKGFWSRFPFAAVDGVIYGFESGYAAAVRYGFDSRLATAETETKIKILWKTHLNPKSKTRKPCGVPVVVNGGIYVGSEEGIFYALSTETGEIRWRHEVGEVAGTFNPIMGFPEPVVVDEAIYVLGGDCGTGYRIYALSAATGDLRWKYDGVGWGTPAVGDEVVYFSRGDCVFALSAKTGEIRWKYKLHGELSAPVVANRVVYIGSDDGFIYAITEAMD